MPIGLIRTWLGYGSRVINTYGSTEATVYQFAHSIPAEAASLTDAEVQEHALCLGKAFNAIQDTPTHAGDDEGAAPAGAQGAAPAGDQGAAPAGGELGNGSRQNIGCTEFDGYIQTWKIQDLGIPGCLVVLFSADSA